MEKNGMRGTPDRQLAMVTTVSTEDLIPADHPIRRIRRVVDTVLAATSTRNGLTAVSAVEVTVPLPDPQATLWPDHQPGQRIEANAQRCMRADRRWPHAKPTSGLSGQEGLPVEVLYRMQSPRRRRWVLPLCTRAA